MEKENKDIIEEKDENLEEVKEETETVEVEETNLEEVKEEKTEEEKEEAPYEGLKATVNVKYDFKTMKYFNMYNTAVKKKLPLWYLLLGILTAGLAIYTIVAGILAHHKDPNNSIMSSVLFGGIFILFTFYLIKQSVKFENLIDRTIINHFQTHKVIEQNIEVREDKITLIPVEKPEESFSYDWGSITSIEEIDEYFFLYIGKSPLILDKDPNRIVDGTYEDLINIINEKTKTISYKRCNKKICKHDINYVHQDLEEQENNAVEVENEEEHVCHCDECENERHEPETENDTCECEVVEEENLEENKKDKTEE